MQADLLFYIGTYTTPIIFGSGERIRAEGKGIYSFSFNPATKKISKPLLLAQVPNPSFLALSPTGRYLYAVNELPSWEGLDSGGISAFSVDSAKGELTLLNQRPTGGCDPCHVCVNSKESHVYVSNFMSGSLSVFPISHDGSLKESSCFIQHEGSSINSIRQKSPHVHSVVFSGKEDFALVSDLGIDRVVAYRPDFLKGSLKEEPRLSLPIPPGSGPRHCVFSADGLFCYVICEMSSTLLVWGRNKDTDSFIHLQTVSTLPAGYTEHSTCADLCLSHDGSYLYASNRGHDSIAIFKRGPKSGLLRLIDIIPSGGKTPRSFSLDPTGNFLIVSHQLSDNIVIFEINQNTGLPQTVDEVFIPSPVCVCPDCTQSL